MTVAGNCLRGTVFARDRTLVVELFSGLVKRNRSSIAWRAGKLFFGNAFALVGGGFIDGIV